MRTTKELNSCEGKERGWRFQEGDNFFLKQALRFYFDTHDNNILYLMIRKLHSSAEVKN